MINLIYHYILNYNQNENFLTVCLWIFCHISESENKNNLLNIDLKGIIKAYMFSNCLNLNNQDCLDKKNSNENIITPLFGIFSRLIVNVQFLNSLNENYINIVYLCIDNIVNNYKLLNLEDRNTYKQVLKSNDAFQDNIIDLLSIILTIVKKDSSIIKQVLEFESKIIIVILEKIFMLNIIHASLKESAIMLYVYLVSNSNEEKDFYYKILSMRMQHICSLKENKCNVIVVMLESLKIIQICVEKLMSLKENVITDELISQITCFQANNVRYDGPIEILCRKIIRYLKNNSNLI